MSFLERHRQRNEMHSPFIPNEENDVSKLVPTEQFVEFFRELNCPDLCLRER